MSDAGSDRPRGLSIALWQEREILEDLKNILPQRAALQKMWERGALNALEKVISDLRTAELDRAVRASMLAREWGADEEATLVELIEKAPTGPWALIFSLHLTTLRMLVYDVGELDDAGWVTKGLSSTLFEFLH